jgi:hypothetical protein
VEGVTLAGRRRLTVSSARRQAVIKGCGLPDGHKKGDEKKDEKERNGREE